MKWICAVGALILLTGPTSGDWGSPENLGPGVNIYTYNFAPSVSVSGDTLYFTRTVGSWDYEIYMSVFRNGVWDSAVSVSDSINTAATAAACPFISYDGSKLYYTMFPPQNPNVQHLYYSERRNGVWQGPRRFEASFNYDSCSVVWPCFTHDMRRLYFFSSYLRPGGRGKGDLWFSDYDTLTRIWGPPGNLGDSINTSEFECSPYLSWDDRILYYSSDTLPYQNMKICRSQMLNGVWQKGVMLPDSPNYPYSTSDNPCLSADGRTLFFMAARLPFPQYGLTDIYVLRWEEGVELPPTGLPRENTLRLVFPSPLRPRTWIKLSGGDSLKIKKVRLFDLQGRLVLTWTEQNFRGRDLMWEGTDGRGKTLVSGVYFFELDVGREKCLFKALILR